jgi:hypothetical protein
MGLRTSERKLRSPQRFEVALSEEENRRENRID